MNTLINSFYKWFIYNHEANRLMISKLQVDDNPPVKAIKVMSHLLNAHEIWINRIYPEGPDKQGSWKIIPIQLMGNKNDDNHFRIKIFLQSERYGMALSKPINYKNSKGEEFTNSIQEIYFHILSHSSYHRGQIALLTKQDNQETANTDFIHLKRIGCLV